MAIKRLKSIKEQLREAVVAEATEEKKFMEEVDDEASKKAKANAIWWLSPEGKATARKTIFKVNPRNRGLFVVIPLVVTLILVIIIIFVDNVKSMLPSANESIVQKGEVCAGFRGGQLVYIEEFADKIPGDICDGEKVMATAIPPTTMPTQVAIVQATASTPIAFPTLTGIQFYAVSVKHDGMVGKTGMWAPVSTEGVSMYTVLVDNAPCGQLVTLPAEYSEILALVETNESVYGPEIITDSDKVTIVCTGTVDIVVYIPPAP